MFTIINKEHENKHTWLTLGRDVLAPTRRQHRAAHMKIICTCINEIIIFLFIKYFIYVIYKCILIKNI